MKRHFFLKVLTLSFLGFAAFSPLFAGMVSFANCSVSEPSPYSLQQSMVAQGTGLDYVISSAPYQAPISIALPPGSTPVTAFLYVEYNNSGADVVPNTTAINFNGSSTGTGISTGAVTYVGWTQTWYSVKYPINPSQITGGGTLGSETAYLLNVTSVPDYCQGYALLVVYTDPAQSTNNVVALADGENVWHLEDNGQVAYGGPPPDAQLDWSCLGLSCSAANIHFSSLGGAAQCFPNSSAFSDQIETWGSGPATASSNFGSANGTPPVWSGPLGALNCLTGSGPDEIVRDYYPPSSALQGASHLEWGLQFASSSEKSTFWQQAIAVQYQCNPVSQCAVTTNFANGSIFAPAPPGWVIGRAPAQEGNWYQSAGGIFFNGGIYSGCLAENNQLLNTQAASGPGTLTVNYSQTQTYDRPNMGGVMWDVNPVTGSGYEIQFDADNCANSDSELVFNVYGAATTTTGNKISTQTVNLPANSALCALSPASVWLQLIITNSNRFIVSIGAAQGSYSYGVTFTDSTYTSGLMGISDYGCVNDVFKWFQWNGVCGAASPSSTPTVTTTPNPASPTPTPVNMGASLTILDPLLLSPAQPVTVVLNYCPDPYNSTELVMQVNNMATVSNPSTITQCSVSVAGSYLWVDKNGTQEQDPSYGTSGSEEAYNMTDNGKPCGPVTFIETIPNATFGSIYDVVAEGAPNYYACGTSANLYAWAPVTIVASTAVPTTTPTLTPTLTPTVIVVMATATFTPTVTVSATATSTTGSTGCIPVAASICASGDDFSTIWVEGVTIGSFPYAGVPGTNDPGNPTCFSVPTNLLTNSTVCLAVETQNTAPENNYSAWDLDITCSGGSHSEITSSGTGISVDYVPVGNPAAPPANDGSGNPWYSPNYSGGAFASTYCSSGVTASTWADPLYNPTTGTALPFIANNCSGDYSTANSAGALFWRQCVSIPGATTQLGPSNLTVTTAQTGAVTNAAGTAVTILYNIVVCNSGAAITSQPTTLALNFLTNTSNCNAFQFNCWGYGDANVPYTMCYYNSSNGLANEPTATNNMMVFPNLGNGCVTAIAQAVDYWAPITCCQTLVSQASVTWAGGTAVSNSVTFSTTCPPTPTLTGSPAPTSTATLTPTVEGTPTSIPITTQTATVTPTSIATSVSTSVVIGANYCSGASYNTIATTYGPLSPGTGNCGFPGGSYDPNLYAAIHYSDYANGLACGACAAVQDAASGGSVTVMVVDNCPSCSTAHQLDLGPAAWNTLTNNAMPGVATITWNFMPCPLSLMTGDTNGTIQWEWKSGCSIDYDPIQFLDMAIPVTGVSFSNSVTGTYTPLQLGSSGVGGAEYWGAPSGNLNSTTGPFYFDTTDAHGDSVTIGPVTVGYCGVLNSTSSQFPGCPATATMAPTHTATPTLTFTASPTLTATVGLPTTTLTPAGTGTLTPATATNTTTPTSTLTVPPANTATATYTATLTATVALTWTPTATQNIPVTLTWTPTGTMTATASPTSTTIHPPTFTWTPSATPGTHTPIPPPGHVCSPPYPNPCDGHHPICVDIACPGTCDVTCDIYTIAFKRLYTSTSRATGNCTVSWNLLDKAGSACGNGLYYLRVTVKGAQGITTQTVKCLILR